MSNANKKIQCFVLMRISSSTYIEYICHNCLKKKMMMMNSCLLNRVSNRKWTALLLLLLLLCPLPMNSIFVHWSILFVDATGQYLFVNRWMCSRQKIEISSFIIQRHCSIELWLMIGNVNERKEKETQWQSSKDDLFMSNQRQTTFSSYSQHRNAKEIEHQCNLLFFRLEHERKWFVLIDWSIDRKVSFSLTLWSSS